MQTIREFIKEYGIKMISQKTDSNPNMPDSNNMDHWKCVLKNGRKQMTIVFSMGYGHKSKHPTMEDVLYCLASDSVFIENALSFEDWCGELGYDSDSRKAEKIYKACQKQSEKLEGLLGPAVYNSLLYETEE